ncbi:MAG: hypothetical protein IPK97_14485 [Ahniella sp.]|nr:hypothetical protein [Ahniella sp.]
MPHQKSSVIYPKDLDAVWLAMDQSGSIAVFVTSGEGPIPITVFGIFAQLENIEPELLMLPEISGKRWDHGARCIPTTQTLLRGLIVYDWKMPFNQDNTYKLAVIPSNGVRLQDMSSGLQRMACSIRLPIARFLDTPQLDVRDVWDCVQLQGQHGSKA